MYDVAPSLRRLPDPFTAAQANEVGIGRHVLPRLLRHQQVERCAPGLYRRSTPLGNDGPVVDWQALVDDYLVRVRAAVTRHPRHAVSHQTAALLTGWPVRVYPGMPVHLTALYVEPRSRRVGDRVLHHSDSVINDVACIDGLPALLAARNAADCLRTMSLPNGVAVADAAVRAADVSVIDIRNVLDTQRRWRGRPKARTALKLVDPLRETWLESYSFVRLHEYGVSLPTPQVEVYDEHRRFVARVDGMWIADGTVGEADGRGKYRLPSDGSDSGGERDAVARVVDEKVREDDVRSVGLELARWDTHEITHNPEMVMRRVNRIRARGDIRRFHGRLRVNGQWINPTEHLRNRGFG